MGRVILLLVASIGCVVSFFIEFFEIPLFSFFQKVTGFYILKNIEPVLKMDIWIILIATGPLIYLLSGINFFIGTVLTVMETEIEDALGETMAGAMTLILLLGSIVYPIFLFIYCWYDDSFLAMFSFAKVGFYVGFIASWVGLVKFVE